MRFVDVKVRAFGKHLPAIVKLTTILGKIADERRAVFSAGVARAIVTSRPLFTGH